MSKVLHHLTVSKMTEWIVNNRYTDEELGKKLKEYYWDIRDELRNNK